MKPTAVYLPSALSTAEDIVISQSDTYAHVGAGESSILHIWCISIMVIRTVHTSKIKITTTFHRWYFWVIGTEFRFRYRTSGIKYFVKQALLTTSDQMG